MNETLTNTDGTVQVNIVRDEHGKIIGVTAWERIDLVSPTYLTPAEPAAFSTLATSSIGDTDRAQGQG